MFVGIVDPFIVSYVGESAFSGVSLVNMFDTIFIYLFTALASGGAVVISQYLGSKDQKKYFKIIKSIINAFNVIFDCIRIGGINI